MTISQLEGFYNGRPRIDFEILEQFSENIIALSGSMYGEIGQAIVTGKDENYLRERVNYYEKVFGKNHFYLEIQEHPDRPMQPKINDQIISLSKKYHYEVVGTNNSYYLTLDDAEVQDMMSAVSAGRELDDPDRNTLMNGDYSVRSSQEMEELFVYMPQAYKNTQKIADMTDLVIEYGDYKIPIFPLSDEQKREFDTYKNFVQENNSQNIEKLQTFQAEEWLLRTLCIDGLNFRYDF